jgi:hypothetical protein
MTLCMASLQHCYSTLPPAIPVRLAARGTLAARAIIKKRS